MKALVTGATGLIGSNIVRELLKDGIEVKAMVRESSDTQNIDGLDIERVNGDIRDAESVKKALEGCDTFYQAAALYTSWMPDNKIYYDINVEGTKAALNAAMEQGIEKVVYTSSIAAVGCYGPENPATEDVEYNMWDMGNHYIRTKYLGELEAKKFCEKGLPVVIVNPAMVMGIRDIKPTPSGGMVLAVLNGEMPGYLDMGLNVVNVEDVARGHVLAAKKGRIGERYILGGENITMKEFFRLIGEIAGIKVPDRKLPYSIALVLSYVSEFASTITKKPPIIRSSMLKAPSKYMYYDCSKAINELGMPQTSARDTLEKAINWFKENGYVKAR